MIARLLVLLLLAGSVLVAPPVGIPATQAVAQDDGGDDDKEDEGKEDKDDDKNEGEGNGDHSGISETDEYTVEVDCQFDESADTTTCTFTGNAPEGASDVSHVDLPEEAVCAEVVGGEHEFVDPDPNTRITGYKSKGSEGTFSLILEGEVTTSGTTTYWFKTGDGVFPAPGPDLQCGAAAREFELAATPGQTEEAGDAGTTASPPAASQDTGDLQVTVYSCADVPEDTTGFDWFGECDLATDAHQFTLTFISETPGDPLTTESDESGNAGFEELQPGVYTLEMTDTNWCHATSDNVDAEGNVTIETDKRTTVWIFTCDAVK
jgi:hypothetical protein